MRLVRSMLLGAGAALGGFILAALIFAVLGIYQSGHGNQAWTDVHVVERRGVHLSLADLIGLAVASGAAVVGFAASYRKP